VSFLASEFGISLNRRSDKYLGYLKMSQVNSLINGYTRMKEKEADAVKRQSGQGSNRFEANTISDLKHVPGVVVKNKKK